MLILPVPSGGRDDGIDLFNDSLAQFLDVIDERFDTCPDGPLPQLQDLLHGPLHGRKLLEHYAEHYGIASFSLLGVSVTRALLQVVTVRALIERPGNGLGSNP
mgnify:CR=1 FL=1